MLLQQIVFTLDAELEKLRSLRSIVSGLSSSGYDDLEGQRGRSTQETLTAEAVPPHTTAQPQTVTRLKPRRAPVRRGPRAKTPAAPSHALAAGRTLPSAPVVVKRDALLSEQARRLQVREAPKRAEPKEELGSLGAMIRALRPGATA